MSKDSCDSLPIIHFSDPISFDDIMWDDDIPSFIQALTNLDDSSFVSSTSAVNSSLKSELETNFNSQEQETQGSVKRWEELAVKQWSCTDVTEWLKYTLVPLSIDPERSLDLDHFHETDGLAISSMTLSDFVQYSSTFGSFLYEKLQMHLRAENSVTNLYQLLPVQNGYKEIPTNTMATITENQLPSPPLDGLSKQNGEEILSDKKKPGRPKGAKRRKQSDQRLGRLWEFIRDLLLSDKYCPKYICWDNYEEGKFRFVESDKVAKLWGSIKGNANMNYEKFSRAMRYYYKSEVLLPVEGRRLVYKFGPKATGWRTNNPNFQL